MTEITMPRLTDSMESGTILTWLVADGATVAVGDDLVELETDKATITYASEAEGILQHAAAPGDTLPVGAVIARLGDASEVAASEAPAGSTAAAASPGSAANGVAGIASGPASSGGAANGVAGDAPAATPLARRIAAAHGVALARIAGSGPRGRITRGDVLRAAGIAPASAGWAAPPNGAPATSPTASPSAPASPAAPLSAAAPASPAAPLSAAAPASPGAVSPSAPLSRVQRVIAERMALAHATVPDFSVQTEVAMDAAIALRAQLKAVADGPVPSYNDLIVKAAALALRAHPRANGSFTDAGFVAHEHVNVGVAVAADDALIVPVIRDADGKSVGRIAEESRALAQAVRDSTIAPADLEGGTFTVSNLGMFGMTAIWPVINVPQAAILGVGALRETLARMDGEIVDRTLLTLTLTCDHRILYGADAARLLAAIKDLLEQPLRLAL